MKTLTFFLTCALSLTTATMGTAAALIHSYDFNSGTVTDSVGGIDGALVGDAAIVGGVLSLDGNGDYAQLNGYAVPTGLTDFSVSIDAQALGGLKNDFVEMISQGSSSLGAPHGFYMGYKADGTMRFGDGFLSTPVVFPTDGLFHTYVLTSQVGVGTNVYIDGALVFSSAIALNNNAGGIQTRFGEQFCCTEYFRGNLDNIKIYDGALSASEISGVVPLPAGGLLLLTGVAMLYRRSKRNNA